MTTRGSSRCGSAKERAHPIGGSNCAAGANGRTCSKPSISEARSALQTVAEGPQRVEQIGDERFLVAVGELLAHRHEHG